MIGEGLIIAIKFTEELIEAEGSEGAFTISFNQWKYVPNGYLEVTTREVDLVEIDQEDAHILYLNFPPGMTHSIQNAVGDITVAYDSTKGTLRGLGGPVQNFTQTFTPTDLEPKYNPHEEEHLSLGLTFDDDLISIQYNNTKEDEHIDLELTFTSTLTYIGDL